MLCHIDFSTKKNPLFLILSLSCKYFRSQVLLRSQLFSLLFSFLLLTFCLLVLHTHVCSVFNYFFHTRSNNVPSIFIFSSFDMFTQFNGGSNSIEKQDWKMKQSANSESNCYFVVLTFSSFSVVPHCSKFMNFTDVMFLIQQDSKMWWISIDWISKKYIPTSYWKFDLIKQWTEMEFLWSFIGWCIPRKEQIFHSRSLTRYSPARHWIQKSKRTDLYDQHAII